jgi:hypothetical protein
MATTQDSTPVIEDKPELFDAALKKVKQTFMTGKTKPYQFRLQ